ncbi:MAG: DUF1905 domain-containing protein [Chthonomonadales bacterium]
MNIEFKSKVWYWKGPAPWYFVTVPAQHVPVLKEMLTQVTYGWGMIPTRVKIGNTEWSTAMFPNDGSYIIPVKASVRKAEKIDEGDEVIIVLSVG